MIYFTKYAEQKFEILNKHKVYFTREQIENVIKLPESLKKKEKLFLACSEGICVVYRKEGDIIKVLTFYPVS